MSGVQPAGAAEPATQDLAERVPAPRARGGVRPRAARTAPGGEGNGVGDERSEGPTDEDLEHSRLLGALAFSIGLIALRLGHSELARSRC